MEYNYRVYRYLNSDEIRLYDVPIKIFESDNNNDDDNKRVVNKWIKKIEDGKEVYVNEYGDYRSDYSIFHSSVNSRNRTIQRIIEYSRSNNWEWFITFTFSPEMVDRFNYDECYAKLHKWLNNVKSRMCPDMVYLVVPEEHDKGGFHFHGLFSNIDTSALKFVQATNYHTHEVIEDIYNINSFKLGFSTASKVKSTQRVSSYIMKYITKELCQATEGKHRYLVSKNIKKPEILEKMVSWEEMQQLKIELSQSATYWKEIDVGHDSISYFQVPKG